MKVKFFTLLTAVFIAAAFGIGTSVNRKALQTNIYDINYKTSFVPANTPSGRVAVYIPRRADNGANAAREYGDTLGVSSEISETDDAFQMEDDDAFLFVYKNKDFLEYHSKTPVNLPKHFSAENAAARAEEFLIGHRLYSPYEEVKVNEENGNYSVIFVNRLGGLLNYAFPTEVNIAYDGKLSLKYYFIKYEKIGSSKVKSMNDAYYELPKISGVTVDLQRCRLVYFYENSIIQSGYLFEGQTAEGQIFECFVKASNYD